MNIQHGLVGSQYNSLYHTLLVYCTTYVPYTLVYIMPPPGPNVHGRYLDIWNRVCAKKVGVGNTSPGAFRISIVRYWHPSWLSSKSSLESRPRGGVIHGVHLPIRYQVHCCCCYALRQKDVYSRRVCRGRPCKCRRRRNNRNSSSKHRQITPPAEAEANTSTN